MIAASLKIRLELKGPVMTKATALGGFGLDAVMAQSDGQYYLPGTLVKGRLRVGTMLHVTLSVDHRPVDGVVAARWMAVLLGFLSEPVRILA